jgi:diguanylate cyclase (GGDEF)-like protein
MMSTDLHVTVCPYYVREVQAAIERIEFDDVHVQVGAGMCSQAQHARTSRSRATSGCAIRIADQPEDSATTHRIHLEHCLTMLADPHVIHAYQQAGAYVVSSGWLYGWETHMRDWGFDQPTARMFFHEWARELVLIDTFVDPQAPIELVRMATYLDLPYRIHPQGLEFLQLTLTRHLLESQIHQVTSDRRQTIEQSNRRIADYAMAFDLLVRLSRLSSEEETIQGICDLFAMLCGCGRLFYAAVENGVVHTISVSLGTPPEPVLLDTALQQFLQHSHTTMGGSGFLIAIRHQQELLGIVGIDALAVPERRRHYLNLSLSIADICGLAIVNARTFSELIQARQQLHQERDRTEQLRQMMTELAGELDLQSVCARIIEHMRQLMPHCNTRILLHEEDVLYYIGDPHTPAQQLPNRPVSISEPPYNRLINQQQVITLHRNRVDDLFFAQPEYAESAVWIGVPLINKERVVGVMTLTSTDPEAGNLAQARTLEAFAHEAAIAIENARTFQNVRSLADTDALTGLFSRRYFDEIATKVLQKARTDQRPLSLILIDIDNFKQVNDHFGHAVGDHALSTVATHLGATLREGDILARYGGEEFVVLLPFDPIQIGMSVAERLRKVIAHQSINTGEHTLHLTISLGIATLDRATTTLNDLLVSADKALYRAKETGRNRVCAWNRDGVTG